MKTLKFYSLLLIIAFMFSCQKEELQIGETKISIGTSETNLTEIPFTDDRTLSEISKSSDIINWQLARKLTLIELEDGFKNSMGWNGCSLAEKPVVIYGKKSQPRYYEFIVLNQSGNAVGTLTAFARRETTSPIAYALPFVRDYTQVISKGSSVKVFSGNYPSLVCVGIPGKSGEEPTGLIDAETGEPIIITENEDFQEMIDFINGLSGEDLQNYGIGDKGEYLSWLEEQNNQNVDYSTIFWQVMQEIQDSLIAMSDTAIIEKCNENKGWLSYKEHIIPAYNSTAMRNTRWNGWCGPSALAWIYRGQYSTYNGTNIPLSGETGFFNWSGRFNDGGLSTGQYFFIGGGDHDGDGRVNHLDREWVRQQSNAIDGGLYHAIAENTSIYTWGTMRLGPSIIINTPIGSVTADPRVTVFNAEQGPTFPWQLGNSLMAVTNNRFDVKFVLSPYAFENIQNRNLPAIINVDKYSHYVTAFGTRHEYNNWTIRITRWFKKTITIPTYNRWFMIHDNGAKTGGNNFQPYWRTSSIWYADLHYNVERK